MLKTVAFLALMVASPAAATGIEIEVSGEGANGTITIDLFEDVAPKHAGRITDLAASGAYNGVVFHRVIDGFMAQTGDVQYGTDPSNLSQAGRGGSDLGNIMFASGHFLNGQYTVVGSVTDGLDVLDAIKLGAGPNGSVVGTPDLMKKVVVVD
jgi:peptidylprolyl isomerase